VKELNRRQALLAAIASPTLFTGCEREAEEPLPPTIRPVRYVEAQSSGGRRVRTFSGAAKPGVESRISFKVNGTIEELPLNVGDLVRKGDLIARIDPRDYELRVEQGAASLAQAEAQAVRALADFERVRGLFERNNASQGEYDAARAQTDSARASVRAIEKQLEEARLFVSYCQLRSPIDGAVAEAPVEVNENVQPGDPIVVLNSGVEPEVEVAIPEVLIGDIRAGAPVGSVTFDALPGERFGGRATEIAPAAAKGLTTYPVTIRLSRPDKRILPGMAAEVGFVFGQSDERQRFVLPPNAVGEDREGRFVFVVDSEGEGKGVVRRRPVTVGELVPSERFSGGIEVVEGLSEGEKVVTAGVSKIADGQQVLVSEDFRE